MRTPMPALLALGIAMAVLPTQATAQTTLERFEEECKAALSNATHRPDYSEVKRACVTKKRGDCWADPSCRARLEADQLENARDKAPGFERFIVWTILLGGAVVIGVRWNDKRKAQNARIAANEAARAARKAQSGAQSDS